MNSFTHTSLPDKINKGGSDFGKLQLWLSILSQITLKLL